jgi:uncharacterized protein (TIGR03435 family)
MKRWIACLWLFPVLAAFAQPVPPKIAFEVASIKPAQPMTMGRVRIGMNVDGGMLRYTGVTLKDCVRTAYRVKEFQVEGPDWIGSERFDIVAKLPAGASRDQVPEMLQSLLAERFKLELHRATKEHAIYALVAGKGGPKLKPAETIATETTMDPPAKPASGSGAAGPPRGAMMMQVDPAGAHLKAPSATLTNLAEMLSRFSERPVVDMTGIPGQYDFDLVFAPENMRGMPGLRNAPPPPAGESGHPPSGVLPEETPEKAGSIYDSVHRYGLKLEPRRAPMEMLIIDHIEKTPTEN